MRQGKRLHPMGKDRSLLHDLAQPAIKGLRGCTGTIPTATGYRLCRLPKRHEGGHE